MIFQRPDLIEAGIIEDGLDLTQPQVEFLEKEDLLQTQQLRFPIKPVAGRGSG
jgi:hypothetical protein